MKIRNIVIILAVLLIIGSLLFEIASRSQSPETIKIGVVATLTGVGSFYGEQAMIGIKLAQDEINLSGGIDGRKIELIIEDSATDLASANNAINKLINVNKVKYIVGDTWNSTTASFVSSTNDNEVLVISPTAILNSLSKDDYLFRTNPNVDAMMKLLADYTYDEMQSRNVGILFADNVYGEEHAHTFKKFFEERGGNIVAEESFPTPASDVRAQIVKVHSKNPDTIFNLHASGPRLGLLMQQAKELGVDVKWIGSFGVEGFALLEQYEDVVEGIVYPYPFDLENGGPGVQAFWQKYESIYGGVPLLETANGYDALKLITSVIEIAGDDTDKAKQYLLGLENYEGGSGSISFDENGDVIKPILIKQIINGEFVTVKR